MFQVASGLCALLLLAPPLAADTIKVSPKGPITSIQEGIDAAAAGDTVLVSAGRYVENVVVPGELDGITLRAKGKVVVDARPNGASGSGAGIAVLADDVHVRGFTVQHAKAFDVLFSEADAGHGIFVDGDRVTIERCTVRRCDEIGVRIVGAQAVVTRCEFLGNGVAPCSIQGAEATIERCDAEMTDGPMSVVGDGGRVCRNDLAGGDGRAITCDGDDVVISANEIRSYADGIQVLGDRSLIDGNDLADIRGTAIECFSVDGGSILDNVVEDGEGQGSHVTVTGNGWFIRRNRFEGGANGGVFAGTSAEIEENTFVGTGGTIQAGSNSRVRENLVADGRATGLPAIYFSSATTPIVVDNTIREWPGDGIFLDVGTSAGEVARNLLVRVGASALLHHGMRLRGSDHDVTDNVVDDVPGDGIDADGTAFEFIGNRISRALEDGLDLQGGSDHQVIGNTVTDCLAVGIENSAAGTVIDDNVSKGNRRDFGNDGSVSSFTGNTSGDGSDDSSAPLVDF